MEFSKYFKVRVPNTGLMKGKKNTKMARLVTVLSNMVIFSFVTGISEIFTVRASNWSCDGKQEKQAKKDYFEASDCVLEIAYLLGRNRVHREFHRKT